MEKDERLEILSDKIRMGIPVGISEAIEAIEYQTALREESKRLPLLAKFIRWLSA